MQRKRIFYPIQTLTSFSADKKLPHLEIRSNKSALYFEFRDYSIIDAG